MMSKTPFVVFLLGLFSLLGACSLLEGDDDVGERTYPEAFDYEYVSLETVRDSNVAAGVFNTRGFVSHVSYCPPCPDDVYCAPCAPTGIFLSTSRDTVDRVLYPYDGDDLFISAENTKQFQVGNQYLASIDITSRDSGHSPVTLLGYTEISEGQLVWLAKTYSGGRQCSPHEEYTPPDVERVLEAEDIRVFDVEIQRLAICRACYCPEYAAIHYVLIPENKSSEALELGFDRQSPNE